MMGALLHDEPASNDGFSDVVAQARYDVAADRIAVTVAEGPGFRCGALQVTGLNSISEANFIRGFAEKLVPASEGFMPARESWWKTGAAIAV